MSRKLTVSACTLVALLLLCSDANACHWRRAAYCGCGGYGYYGGYGYSYGASYIYGAGYGYAGYRYARPGFGHYGDSNYFYTRPAGYAPGYGQYGDVYSAYVRPAGYAPGYGQYGDGGYDYRYNPGGVGGPRSGLGVRPGPGFGGLGPRR
jgi:hypothetical protein